MHPRFLQLFKDYVLSLHGFTPPIFVPSIPRLHVCSFPFGAAPTSRILRRFPHESGPATEGGRSTAACKARMPRRKRPRIHGGRQKKKREIPRKSGIPRLTDSMAS